MVKMDNRIQRAMDTVRQVLATADLNPTLLDDGAGFEAHFSDDGPQVRSYALVYKEEKFLFYFQFIRRAPREAILATAEYLTRANLGLTVGNFEFDFDSGMVRYKSSLDFSGIDLPAILVRNIVLSGIYCMEAYSYALFDVMDRKSNPAAAIEQVEATISDARSDS